MTGTNNIEIGTDRDSGSISRRTLAEVALVAGLVAPGLVALALTDDPARSVQCATVVAIDDNRPC